MVNIAKRGYRPMRAVRATMTGEHLAIDLAVGLKPSNRNDVYVLIAIDAYTRFVFLHALKDKTAAGEVRYLFNLFCFNGFPKIIQSDSGGELSNNFLQAILSKLKVEHHLCTTYLPCSNGVAERSVQNVKNMLRKMVQEILRIGIDICRLYSYSSMQERRLFSILLHSAHFLVVHSIALVIVVAWKVSCSLTRILKQDSDTSLSWFIQLLYLGKG
jgi:transposase InsO family protein